MSDATIHPSGRALTPYDTGDALEPHTWTGANRRTDEDFGKVDLDNDEGWTVATLRAVRETPGSSVYVLHLTNTDPDGAPGEGIPGVFQVVIDGVRYEPAPPRGPWRVAIHPFNLDGWMLERSIGDPDAEGGDVEYYYREGQSNGITKFTDLGSAGYLARVLNDKEGQE